MSEKNPSIFQMMRAAFFSSILSPLISGSLLAAFITHRFQWWGFLLVIITGLGLHAATNIYNDIYDTLQGTDKINRFRNEFSGGSGLIIRNPQILPRMYSVAQLSLVVALFTTGLLMFVVERSLWFYLWGLYFLSAFFSKYYTAAPVKFASRGFGEIFVWFAFGPMAILIASVSQNLGLHPLIITAMPITGISTLSILLLGQLIDYPADKESGKWGVAVRLGRRPTVYIYITVQLLLMINVVILSFLLQGFGFLILICLLPYFILLPKIIRGLLPHYDQPALLQKAAGMNVQLHLQFSVLLAIGILLFKLLGKV
jgi:1,4-dihydroxy-2-naphthoate octaprenyltransferase